MTDSSGPTLHRRRLGHALRRLREESRLTGKQVGDAVERSSSWISRVESGRVGLRVRDLRDLCDVYGVTDQQRRAELESLAREGKQRGWWSQYGEAVSEGYGVYIGLENDADSLMLYSNTVVPGLFQTESYMRALYQTYIPPALSADPRIYEDRIQVRLRRQQLLQRVPPPAATAVLDQSVLHRHYGGRDVLREQLQHLANLIASGTAKIHVLPFTRADSATLTHSFTILELGDQAGVVYSEAFEENILHEKNEVMAYRDIFSHLTTLSLTEEESRIALCGEATKLL
jgi:transcriptional regulator with XRE-family HTH domain